MREMFDADNPFEIPRNAKMVAGYIDGRATTWRSEWWQQFPEAKLVTISAVGARWDADVFDVEPGCIWPPENVLPLIAQARKAGRNPTVYCNEQNHWPGIRQMFRDRNIAEPPYWVANYDRIAEVPAGAVAKQYMHPPQTGKHFDVSAVLDFWPGVDEDEENMPTADEIAVAVVRQLFSGNLYVLDERPDVVEEERHHTTFKNAVWSTWHTMHYGDEGRPGVAGLFPSNKDIRDAAVDSGVEFTPEQMETFVKKMEEAMKTVLAAGVRLGMQQMHAVFAPRPNEGT